MMTTSDPTTGREIVPALTIPQELLDQLAAVEAGLRAAVDELERGRYLVQQVETILRGHPIGASNEGWDDLAAAVPGYLEVPQTYGNVRRRVKVFGDRVACPEG